MLRQVGRYVESDAQLHKSLELSPQRIVSHLVLAANAVQTGRVEEALVQAELEPAPWARLLAQALAHHAAGHAREAAAALEEMEREHATDSPYQIALAHGFMGHPDQAFQWLDRAWAERDGGLPFAKNEPLLQGIRSDPRWRPFLERMKQAD
jgi:hypothetical protein